MQDTQKQCCELKRPDYIHRQLKVVIGSLLQRQTTNGYTCITMPLTYAAITCAETCNCRMPGPTFTGCQDVHLQDARLSTSTSCNSEIQSKRYLLCLHELGGSQSLRVAM